MVDHFFVFYTLNKNSCYWYLYHKSHVYKTIRILCFNEWSGHFTFTCFVVLMAGFWRHQRMASPCCLSCWFSTTCWLEDYNIPTLRYLWIPLFSSSFYPYICTHTHTHTLVYKVKVKVKWSRYRPGVAQRVGRGIALLFHDQGTRRGWVASSTPRPQFTPGKDPVPILQEAGRAPGPGWTGRKSRPHQDSTPDRPVRSQLLYRLSYPVRSL